MRFPLPVSFMFLIIAACSVCAEETTPERDTSVNQPPMLLTNPLTEIAPVLLKSGICGTATIEASINSSGNCDTFTVATDSPGLDSLLSINLRRAKFAPAVERGKPVAATARFEIEVHPDSLLAECLQLPPVFSGTVADTAPYTLIPNARILIHYEDTTEDRELGTGFHDYLSRVGKAIHLLYDGTVLTAETDSQGEFSLKLLPAGTVTLSVQAAGYEPARFRINLTSTKQIAQMLALTALPERTVDSTYDITVHGHQFFTDKNVLIAEEERRIGITPYLSSLVQSKAEIRRVPEGPSMMLVRSGTPFDNTYIIAGIPMLAPFHFGGYPYADIDGLMISALKNVSVNLEGIAAKRIDVSGCIVEAEPGRIDYDYVPAVQGVYVKGDFSIAGLDLLAACAKKNSTDYLQLGVTASQQYSLAYLRRFYTSVSDGNYGTGIPTTFANATFSGSKKIGSFNVSAFVWGAADVYDTSKNISATMQGGSATDNAEKFIPWGMASLRIAPDASTRSLTLGRAHQFFGNGNQFGNSIFETRSTLDNSEMVIDFDTVRLAPCIMTLSARMNRDEWSGWMREQNALEEGSFVKRNGTEHGLHGTTSLANRFGKLSTSVNVLGSVIRYNDEAQLIGDAGVSVSYEMDKSSAGLHIGRVTSRPDIRGLPDADFRKKLDHTYLISLPFFIRNRTFTRFGIEPYYRYSSSLPQLDPQTKIWAPEQSTPLSAVGVDIESRFNPAAFAECFAALNLANAHRSSSEGTAIAYEWNLPWTVRTGVHLFDKKERVHLYVNYLHSSGLPYFDIKTQDYGELPRYRSLDVSFQYRTIFYNIIIKRLDCYFGIKNVLDLVERTNVRDYYWNPLGYRNAIYLGFGRVDLGLRFGMKL